MIKRITIYSLISCLIALAPAKEANAQCEAPNVFTSTFSQSSSYLNVAYSPLHDQYYFATHFEVAVTDAAGNFISNTDISSGSPSPFMMGIWWNPLTNQLESNPLCSASRQIRVEDLDGSGIPTNTSSNLFVCNTPFQESMGSFDPDNNEIIYYNGGSIHRYDRATNNLVATLPITGTTGTLVSGFVGYSSEGGGKYIVASHTADEVYAIDKTTGAVANAFTLTGGDTNIGGAAQASGFANGIYFHRNNGAWHGHQACGLSPLIPTMGEWSLIIFGLIVLSFATVYVMRWNRTLVLRTQH